MVLPSLFSKSSKKKQDATPNNNNTGTSSQGTPPSSPEKKAFPRISKDRDRDRDRRSNSTHSNKSFSRSAKYDRDSHPLNLPPDELRRLSSAMSDQPTPTPMDVDREFTSSPVPSSPANVPQAPGAFPKANASNGEEEAGPAPPPHRIPTSPPPQPQHQPQPPPQPQPQQPTADAEACKVSGNKFFKTKEYAKAILEYSKGSCNT